MGHTRDLDRAEAIKSICEAGESRRSLAKEVGCSEALLRDLLKVANVPLADRVLARRGEISTREFVRRSKAAAKLEAEKAKITEEKRRAKESEKWSISICDWLQAQGLAWAHQKNVIETTRCELIEAERLGTLPKAVVRTGVPLKTIIDRTRPTESGWDQTLEIYFYISWLAHWTLYAIPNVIVRDAALSHALVTIQHRRYE